jgi:hypothetical protein
VLISIPAIFNLAVCYLNYIKQEVNSNALFNMQKKLLDCFAFLNFYQEIKIDKRLSILLFFTNFLSIGAGAIFQVVVSTLS